MNIVAKEFIGNKCNHNISSRIKHYKARANSLYIITLGDKKIFQRLVRFVS